MKKVIVLGAGMVGSVMAADLATDPSLDVSVADARRDALDRVTKLAKVNPVLADLGTAEAVRATIAEYDLVLAALSSSMGFRTLRAILEAKKPCVDISFMAEDALELDGLAKESGVPAIVDCGVGPGLSNILCGYATTVLAPCTHLAIYVGGLPLVRKKPFDYKVAFAPSDVIEEYVRPARIVEHGEVVVRPALTELEPMDLPRVGTVEAFNTDGLRSLARTLRVPHMKEKTLRWPGHVTLMRALADAGFFSEEPIEVRGSRVRPVDVAAKLLFPHWTYDEGEADLTVMRVEARGLLGGERARMTWDLYDERDPATGFRSMSRTTGFPATIVLRMLARGEVTTPGVIAPELLGQREGVAAHVVDELERRGVHVEARIEREA